jgi:sensor histidine kinase YesM
MKPNNETMDAPAKKRTLGNRLLADVKYALIINLICALIVTFLLSSGHEFFENLVASNCVGCLAFLLLDGGRFLLWRHLRQPRPWFVLLCTVAVPISQYGGLAIYRWLWGYRSMSVTEMASAKYLSLTLFSLMAAGGATLFFANREKMMRLQAAADADRARAATVERQATQAQLQLLQAQIEPHMLFNTLANLQGLIGFDPERAQLLLDHLIQYLRATLGSSRARSTTLGQEFALMQAYLSLMSIRMGTRLTFSLALPASLEAVAMPPMLLQPLVENAIRHGIEPKIDGGHIAVSAERDGDSLVLTVADTGLGLDHPDQDRHGTHVGLANIRERLAVLYADGATLALTNARPAGAIARMTLPLSSAETAFASATATPADAARAASAPAPLVSTAITTTP